MVVRISGDILARGGAGEHRAELLGDDVLHVLHDRHQLARPASRARSPESVISTSSS